MTMTLPRKLMALLLSAALAVSLLPATAFAAVAAADADSASHESARAGAVPMKQVAAKTWGATQSESYEGYSVTVSYPDVPITLGEPVEFSLSVSGAKGTLRYRLSSIYPLAGNSLQPSPIDCSQLPGFGASNEFSFAFTDNGIYQVRFRVEDPETPLLSLKDWYILVTVDDKATLTWQQIASEVANECLTAGMRTDFDKALWLHDWLLDHVTYDYSYQNMTAQRAFLLGSATCEGYHAAYCRMLELVGVESSRIETQVDKHVWTAVKMDGQWYHVDVTKDDVEYVPLPGYPDERHLYFGMSDAAMGNMEGHRDFILAAAAAGGCNSLDDNYFIRTGKIKQYSDPYAAQIQAKLGQGAVSFTIAADQSVTWWQQPKIADRIYRLVAEQLQRQDYSINGTTYAATVTYADDSFAVTLAPKPQTPPAVKPGSTTDSNSSSTSTAQTAKKSLAKAKILGLVSKARTGKAIKQAPVVKLGSTTLKAGRDYTVSYKNNKKLGKATVTVKGKGAYTGSKSATFKIVKYKQPMTCKAKAKALKAKTVKKKAVSFARPITVKKAKGKLTYVNASTSKAAKKLKVNAKTGRVTVPKGTKKGSYTLKIRVNAAGSGNYAYGSKVVAVKIRVR